MTKAPSWLAGQGRPISRTLILGAAVVLDVIDQSMARYPSGGRSVAVLWLCLDLALFAAVARGSRAAWRILGALTAFGAVVLLIAGIEEPSGFQLSRGLLFAAQLLLLLSPGVRTGREQLEARAG